MQSIRVSVRDAEGIRVTAEKGSDEGATDDARATDHIDRLEEPREVVERPLVKKPENQQ